ncbi:MAG: hypothetical protein EXR07_03400 [Acetobacteraceae bacterium]|nr:hypothetical protein [Acetobacteraceae bacterium]
MAKQVSDTDLAAVEQAIGRFSGGASALVILDALARPIPLRTLQHRIKYLAGRGRVFKVGNGRSTKYHLPAGRSREDAVPSTDDEPTVPLSPSGISIRDYVQGPLEARAPVGYDRGFLDLYRPNVSAYLSRTERAHLVEIGRPRIAGQPAGTYAKQILSRLLIDLSWNSSRLEGNTYSLLDTRRLIELGEEADGHGQLEAQMILNHKDAIEFLVNAAEEVGFNRYTILNLHALLANNLLADPAAAGRLRYIAVGIEGSVFLPLEVPQLIEEYFDQILATAAAIRDPFEQAFFAMVQMPYLQPFDDVNKRVSRLAANIPLIKGNFSPLSFTDVPHRTYTDAVLGVYEMRRVDLLKDVFIWAYERSAARHGAVRQSLGEPDPFRLRYRSELREIVGELIRGGLRRKDAAARIAAWAREKIAREDQPRFIEVVEYELISMHEGNFARYQIRPSEFAAWQTVWAASA